MTIAGARQVALVRAGKLAIRQPVATHEALTIGAFVGGRDIHRFVARPLWRGRVDRFRSAQTSNPGMTNSSGVRGSAATRGRPRSH